MLMNIRAARYFAFTTLVLLWSAQNALAQGRGGSALQQSGQQSAFGIGSQSTFGTGGQAGIGQGGGRQSQFGSTRQSGGQFGGAQGGNLNQPRVGGQDGFVGSDADQIRNQFRDPRQQRRAMFDFAVESLNEMRESRRERNSRNKQSPVRVRLNPRFTVRPPNTAEVATRVSQTLGRAMPESSATTQVTLNGSSAKIEGTVKSEYERMLATKMLSITPGIYQVENQLTIQPTLTSPASR